MNKILAFIKKDFQIEASYKLAFLFNFFAVFSSIFIYYFIGELFGHQAVDHLKNFGVNYFSYVLLSMTFFNYIGVGLGSFSDQIRREQIQGTLESLLMTPTKITTLLLSMSLWSFIFATFNAAIYILCGIFLFKIDFSQINILSCCFILILTIITFSCLGILSACFVLIFKRGNPIGWVINSLEGILGGVYYPITVMPIFLQTLAKFIPITYAIRAIQLAVYQGYTIVQLKQEILILLSFAIILLPISIKAFASALKKARLRGHLAQH